MVQEYLAKSLPDKEKIEYALYASKLVLKCFKEYYPDNNTVNYPALTDGASWFFDKILFSA